MPNTLGEYLKAQRQRLRISLREFARSIGMDASNYSRIEKGHSPPPTGDFLKRVALQIGITPGSSPDWERLEVMADVARGRIPEDLMSNEEIAAALPAFFQEVRQRHGSMTSAEDLYDVFRDVIARR